MYGFCEVCVLFVDLLRVSFKIFYCTSYFLSVEFVSLLLCLFYVFKLPYVFMFFLFVACFLFWLLIIVLFFGFVCCFSFLICYFIFGGSVGYFSCCFDFREDRTEWVIGSKLRPSLRLSETLSLSLKSPYYDYLFLSLTSQCLFSFFLYLLTSTPMPSSSGYQSALHFILELRQSRRARHSSLTLPVM